MIEAAGDKDYLDWSLRCDFIPFSVEFVHIIENLYNRKYDK